jgi:hypothetical protein
VSPTSGSVKLPEKVAVCWLTSVEVPTIAPAVGPTLVGGGGGGVAKSLVMLVNWI